MSGVTRKHQARIITLGCVSRSPVRLKRLSCAGVEFCPQPQQGSHLDSFPSAGLSGVSRKSQFDMRPPGNAAHRRRTNSLEGFYFRCHACDTWDGSRPRPSGRRPESLGTDGFDMTLICLANAGRTQALRTEGRRHLGRASHRVVLTF